MENIELYDIIELKKPHPCKERCKQFEVIRVGADVKLKCCGCGAVIMMSRYDLQFRFKRIVSKHL